MFWNRHVCMCVCVLPCVYTQAQTHIHTLIDSHVHTRTPWGRISEETVFPAQQWWIKTQFSYRSLGSPIFPVSIDTMRKEQLKNLNILKDRLPRFITYTSKTRKFSVHFSWVFMVGLGTGRFVTFPESLRAPWLLLVGWRGERTCWLLWGFPL